MRRYGRRVLAVGLESGSAMSDQGGNNLIRDQLAGLFASLSRAVIVTDLDGAITLFNSHAEELLGYELERVAGAPIGRLFQDPETLNRLTEQSDSMPDGTSMDCETFTVNKEGESVLVYVSMSGLFKGSRRIGRIIYLDAVQLEKRTEDRLNLLLAASNLIAKAKNLKEGLQGLAEMIVSMLSSTFCRILLIDEQEKNLVVKAAWHKKQPNDDFKWIALEDEQTPIDEWPGLRDRLDKGDAAVLNQNDERVSGNLKKLAKRLGLQKPIRSVISVPVKIDKRIVGLLVIGNLVGDGEALFDKQKRDLAAGIAAQVAALIKRLQLADDSAQRLSNVEAMRNAAKALAAALDLKEVLRQILLNAKLVLGADSAVIWSYNSTQGSFSLEISESTGIPTETQQAISKMQPQKGGATYAVLERGWVGVDDVNVAAGSSFIGESVRKLLDTFKARSFQGVVLKVRNEKIGVLYLNYKHARTYTEEDRQIVQTFADHVALALANAKLLDQFKKAKKAAEVVAKVMVLGDPGMTLKSIVDGTQQVLRSDAVVLFTYDELSSRFSHPPTMAGVRFPDRAAVSEERLTGSIVHLMLDQDKPYVVNNVADDPLFGDRRFAIDEQIKSCVAISLKAANQRVGVMFVNYRTLHPITFNDLANLELFANYAAVAIHYDRLFEEKQAGLKEQASLVALSQTILESLGRGASLKGIMEMVVAAAAVVLGTEFCNIVLPDKDDRLVFSAAHGWPISMVGDFTLEPGLGSQTGYTIQTEAPVRVYDYKTEERFAVPDVVFKHSIRSGISVPMIRGNKVVGAMLAHTTRQRRFTDADERRLSLLANFLATVISSARYEQIKQHNEDLESIYEASKAITSLTVERERKQILDRILREAVKCIKRRRNREVVLGTIQLYDEQTQQLVFESIYPKEIGEDDINIGMGWRVSEETAGERIGVTGRAFLTKKPQLVDNVDDLREAGDYREYSPQTRSELAMPMVDDSEDRCLGVLDVESGEVGSFDEYDQYMMKLLAELGVIGIQSLQRYKDLQARHAIAWMGISGGYWLHKIRGNAGLINDHATKIREGLAPGLDEEITAELSSIERHANRILNYDTTIPTKEKATPQPVNALLRERIRNSQDFKPHIYKPVEVRFRLELPDDAQVKVDPTWFFRTLDTLLDNATTAMRDSPTKTLTIATREQNGSALIEITDTGKGIPKHVQQKLFLEQIKGGDVTGNSGVGLLIAHLILKAYDGQIKLGSSDSTDTTMVILLPLFKS
jgi:PAS domain S-box-containing protein